LRRPWMAWGDTVFMVVTELSACGLPRVRRHVLNMASHFISVTFGAGYDIQRIQDFKVSKVNGISGGQKGKIVELTIKEFPPILKGLLALHAQQYGE